MDTIGNFCTCIRNAISAGREKVDVPSSNMRKNIAGKVGAVWLHSWFSCGRRRQAGNDENLLKL